MKAILEFSLPDDADEFRIATQAPVMASAIESALSHIRSRLKHGELSTAATEELEAVRKLLLEVEL